jgi:hypothetical protein
LPKDATEVVAAVIGDEKQTIFITAVKGAVLRKLLGKTAVGSRAIKPRDMTGIRKSDRPTGVVALRDRPAVTENRDE